jgi:hypothetical protein
MKRVMILCLLFAVSTAFAANPNKLKAKPTAKPTAKPAAKATATPRAVPTTTTASTTVDKGSTAVPPWDTWFKDNTMVTDKDKYVHFFWNAQDFKANFEVKEKKRKLAASALELVKRLYPAKAKADWVKVDIVYVLERDEYGLPKWDSLKKVAHIEYLKSKVSQQPGMNEAALSEEFFKKTFDKFELY